MSSTTGQKYMFILMFTLIYRYIFFILVGLNLCILFALLKGMMLLLEHNKRLRQKVLLYMLFSYVCFLKWVSMDTCMHAYFLVKSYFNLIQVWRIKQAKEIDVFGWKVGFHEAGQYFSESVPQPYDHTSDTFLKLY